VDISKLIISFLFLQFATIRNFLLPLPLSLSSLSLFLSEAHALTHVRIDISIWQNILYKYRPKILQFLQNFFS